MSIRVATFSFSQRAIHFSSLHRDSILKHQQQISSGLKFQRPSEQPVAYRLASSLRSRYAELEADRNSIDLATSVVNASVNQLESYNLVITRAKGLAQQGIQALDNDERRALALEVDGLIGELKGITLARFGDKFLFGGTRSESPPFTFTDSNANTGSIDVVYNGSDQRSRANVGDLISIDTYYSGREIFSGAGREPTVIIGHTGAKPGQGTDTLSSRSRLDVSHVSTAYAGGSGIQAGISSPGGDTIIGTHQITIVDTAGDGSAGTISINGADPVAFTSADTDLLVSGPTGQSVYVDASNITPGFNGTISASATGNLSVDEGATQIAIDFSGNQVIADSRSGKIVTIDSSAIRQTGSDQLEFPGTANAIELLSNLADDLRNTRGLDSHSLADSLDRRLGELHGIGEKAFETLGEQATSLRTMDALATRVDDLRLSVETRVSNVQATDMPEAVLRLENSQQLLQYTYAVTASINQLSLLNFLN